MAMKQSHRRYTWWVLILAKEDFNNIQIIKETQPIKKHIKTTREQSPKMEQKNKFQKPK